MNIERALIVGAGPGISASFARKLAARGVRLALASRSTAKLSDLAAETGAMTVACDASEAGSVNDAFTAIL